LVSPSKLVEIVTVIISLLNVDQNRHSFGEQMSAKKWAKEAAGQRDIMAAYGGVRAEDIRGLRAPFLSVIAFFILCLV